MHVLQLKEVVHGKDIWVCPNKLGAAVKDTESKSRTVLVLSLIELFYKREELLSKKSLSELDRNVVEACVGKCTKPSMFLLYNVQLDHSVVGKRGEKKFPNSSKDQWSGMSKSSCLSYAHTLQAFFKPKLIHQNILACTDIAGLLTVSYWGPNMRISCTTCVVVYLGSSN